MTRITPIGALVRGLAAGAAGSFVQSLFFKATAKLAPQPPTAAFTPPDEVQKSEMTTVTVARRFSEGLLKRPISDEIKLKAGHAVHYTYGSLWGGLYGLLRESFPASMTGPISAATFGTAVWAVSDNLVLPAFKLAAWPQAYSAKSHAYAWTAHVAYGCGIWGAYSLMVKAPLLAGAVQLWAARKSLMASLSAARRLPSPIMRGYVRERLRHAPKVQRAAQAIADISS